MINNWPKLKFEPKTKLTTQMQTKLKKSLDSINSNSLIILKSTQTHKQPKYVNNHARVDR